MERNLVLAATVRQMDRAPTVQPMSDHRLLLAVIGVLTAALGVALILLSLLGLRHPLGSTGEIGTPTDFTSLLINGIWLGGLLAIVGFGASVTLVRAQLRPTRAKR